jgi:beta-N-acetylhexosaminidase
MPRLTLLAFLLFTTVLSMLSSSAGDAERAPLIFEEPTAAILAEKTPPKKKPPFVVNDWVDSVYESMSDTARLGQLFMVAAFSTGDKPDAKLLQLIQQYHLGGLIFMKGSPLRQAQLTNTYQAAAKVPLLVAMDAEWGLNMRLDSTVKYPYQMTLGAIEDDELIYEMGKQIAQQCRRLGVHVSFSPVVDVNNNPNNPVIGFRAFGEDKQDVATKGVAYMRGLQDHGVLACAKHFPGHGDTDVDSHYGLPVVKASKKQLDTLELMPFKRLIREGVGSVMVAHLAIPSLDDTKNQASTLSPKVVNKLLKDELDFEGLVFTDALNMKGVADFYPPGEVDAQALLAGNDVLLYSMDVPTAIQRIFLALEEDRLKWRDIEKRVKRILAVKYWVGLNAYAPVALDNLYNDLNPAAAGALNQRIFEQAITLVRNNDKFLPLRGRSTARRLHLGIGEPTASEFYNALGIYGSMEHRYLPMKADSIQLKTLAAELVNYDEIIVSWHLSTQRAGQKFGIHPATVAAIKGLLQDKKSVQVVFGNAYALPQFDFGTALVCGFEEHPWAYKNAAQLLFGAMAFKGKLPVSVSETLKAGTGLSSSVNWNLRLVDPSKFGYSRAQLQRIDSIMGMALRMGATPGAQILAARGNEVFFIGSYGHTSQTKTLPVSQATVYDLASLSKVLATGIGLMQRYDQNQLPIDSSLGFFLPELQGSELGRRSLRQLMTHQAGLPAFVPYWKRTFKNKNPDPTFYITIAAANDSLQMPLLQVAESLYAQPATRDSVWAWIKTTPLQAAGKYVYSDLGLHVLWRVLERAWGEAPERWLDRNWYEPLGTVTLGFQPRARLPLALIAPTENDQEFRQQLVHGHVHDQTAALLGGVAGHAGLFSNAADIVRVLQPLARPGTAVTSKAPSLQAYTVDLFSSPQYAGNRRGLLWDRQLSDRNVAGPVGQAPSKISYGHTGFTGTMVWIDPQTDLIFIFLSNRVHPSVSPNRLAELNVRTQVLEVFYKSN